MGGDLLPATSLFALAAGFPAPIERSVPGSGPGGPWRQGWAFIWRVQVEVNPPGGFAATLPSKGRDLRAFILAPPRIFPRWLLNFPDCQRPRVTSGRVGRRRRAPDIKRLENSGGPKHPAGATRQGFRVAGIAVAK
jgi:hypothetical protein